MADLETGNGWLFKVSLLPRQHDSHGQRSFGSFHGFQGTSPTCHHANQALISSTITQICYLSHCESFLSTLLPRDRGERAQASQRKWHSMRNALLSPRKKVTSLMKLTSKALQPQTASNCVLLHIWHHRLQVPCLRITFAFQKNWWENCSSGMRRKMDDLGRSSEG